MTAPKYGTEKHISDREVVRLFCFAHAGGGHSAFRNWAALLPSHYEVHAVHVTVEQKRSAGTRLAPLAAILSDTLSGQLVPPFVFFGHSMGALIAFEVARELRRCRLPVPSLFLPSGFRAPHLLPRVRDLHTLSDSELIERIRRMGGTPEMLLADPDFASMFLPSLRSDFELLDTYVYRAEAPLDIPIIALFGMKDKIKIADVDAWRFQTTQSFEMRGFPGGHFFPQDRESDFLNQVAERISWNLVASREDTRNLASRDKVGSDCSVGQLGA